MESKLKLIKWPAWVLVHGRVSAHMLTLAAMSVSSENRPECPQHRLFLRLQPQPTRAALWETEPFFALELLVVRIGGEGGS